MSSSEMMESEWKLPLGFRFCPTDAELVVGYLARKMKNLPLPFHGAINSVTLYHYTPDQLAATYDDKGQKEWYFFTVIDKKKMEGGKAHDRLLATGDGYWKASSKAKPVRYEGVKVGSKRNLVFYQEGKKKTNWIMNEYFIDASETGNSDNGQQDFALCKIYNKDYKKGGDLPITPLSPQSPASASSQQKSDSISDRAVHELSLRLSVSTACIGAVRSPKKHRFR